MGNKGTIKASPIQKFSNLLSILCTCAGLRYDERKADGGNAGTLAYFKINEYSKSKKVVLNKISLASYSKLNRNLTLLQTIN